MGDWWHAEMGVAVTLEWTSQILGNVINPLGAPTVAIDPGYFDDTLVAQTTTAGDRWFNTAIATPIGVAGDRFYLCGTMRHQILVTGTQDRMMLSARGGSGGTEAQLRFGLDSDGAGTDWTMARRQNAFAGASALFVGQDTDPHFYEVWSDPVLGTVVCRDGVQIVNDASATGQAAWLAAVSMVCVGGSFTGAMPGTSTTNAAQCSMKWFLVWNQLPTGPERAAFLAYSQTNYFTP